MVVERSRAVLPSEVMVVLVTLSVRPDERRAAARRMRLESSAASSGGPQMLTSSR